MELVKGIRNLRTENGIAPGERLPALIAAGENRDLLESQKSLLISLAKLDQDKTEIRKALGEKPVGNLSLVLRGVEVFIPAPIKADGALDRTRQEQDLHEAESQIERLEKLLSSDFAKRAPAALVEKERDKLRSFQETAGKLRNQLK
jgi:valyl-tRNA synthetase